MSALIKKVQSGTAQFDNITFKVIEESILFMHMTIQKIAFVQKQWFRNPNLLIEQKKHPLDLVSNVDKESSNIFIQKLGENFPDHGYVCEEGGEHNTDSDFVWFIDPLDGTLNYITGMPDYAIIIGLQYQGQTVISGVCIPSRDEYYFAVEGRGAIASHLNSYITCSKQTTISNSLGLTNDTVTNSRINYLQRLKQYEPNAKFWASSLGCTGVSCGYVAEGRKHWYLCSGGGGIWDYVGTVFLLEQSGCVVTAPDGSPWKHGTGPFIAANPILHEELVKAFTVEEAE